MSMQWNGSEWVIVSPRKNQQRNPAHVATQYTRNTGVGRNHIQDANQLYSSSSQRRWETADSSLSYHRQPVNQLNASASQRRWETADTAQYYHKQVPSTFQSSAEEQLFWEEQQKQNIAYQEMILAQHYHESMNSNKYGLNASNTRQANFNQTSQQKSEKSSVSNKSGSKRKESPEKTVIKPKNTKSTNRDNCWNLPDTIKNSPKSVDSKSSKYDNHRNLVDTNQNSSDSSMGSLCDSSGDGGDSEDEEKSSPEKKSSAKSFKEAVEQKPHKSLASSSKPEIRDSKQGSSQVTNRKDTPKKIAEKVIKWKEEWDKQVTASSKTRLSDKQKNQFHKEANRTIQSVCTNDLNRIIGTLLLKKDNNKSKMCYELLNFLKDSNNIGYCYYKLSKICTDIQDVELYSEAYDALKHGLDAVTDESEKFFLLYEILKVKAKIPFEKQTYLKVSVSKKVSDDVFIALMKENDDMSFKAIENYILHSSLKTDLAKYELKDYLEKKLSEKCLERIVSQYKPVTIEMVEETLGKGRYGACAKLISMMQEDSSIKTSTIFVATELVVKTGKKELLEKIFTMPDTFKVDDFKQFEAALLFCCKDKSSTSKVDAVNTLLSYIKKKGYVLNLENQIKTLSEADLRRQLISSTKVGASTLTVSDSTDSKASSSKKKKKRKKRISEASSDGQLDTKNQQSEKVVHVHSIWDDINLLIETVNFDIEDDDLNMSFIEDDGDDNDTEMVFADEDDDKLSDDEDDDKFSGDKDDDILSKSMLHVRNLSVQNFSDGPVNLGIDGMPWEVECTQDVWVFLRDKKTPVYLKEKILSDIRVLASGNWRKRLSKPLQNLNSNIRLYQAKISKSCWMIWEMSISFSARCSINDYNSNELDHEKSCEKGSVYVDKIRIWNIALKSDDLPKMIDQIIFSYKRGQSCLIQRNLKGIKQEPMLVNHEHLPNIYINENYMSDYLKQMKTQNSKLNLDGQKYIFFPPANPNDQEYNILKFYAFTTAMASRVLSLTKSQLDFPFQVSELEHTIIHLEPKNGCAVLLLGRSGTGKTTCCLYRLYKHYQSYWDAAQHAGPHIPKFKYLMQEKVSQDTVEQEEVESEELHHSASEMNSEDESNSEDDEYVLVPCLCNGDCDCLPIYAPRKLKNPARNSKRRQSSASSSKSESEALPCSSATEVHVASSPSFSDISESEVNKDDPIEETSQYEDLRQLLVTKNEVLCNEIKKNFSELCIGCPNGQYEPCDPKEYSDVKKIPPQKYPLFITTKDLLVLLDGSLEGSPFFDRDKSGALLHDVAGWGKNKVHLSILPLDDVEEEDELEEHEEDETEEGEQKKEEKKEIVTSTKVKEVTYDIFAHEIWPQISKSRYGKDCHPSLVWMEIKSFIKGSAESFLSEHGYLTKDEYLSIGKKKAPNFTGNREDIYSLFLLYRKIKISNRYFDEMDVHFNIYQRLKRVLIPDWAFHQVYVDETQDFTQGELLLLLRCSLNQNAMFFSGDTAQSIINGVSFRFCDLKSLFLIAKEEFERNRLISPVVVPKRIHQLTHNYRSHSGILKLASSIVHLLELFFPESFDKLSPDVGLFDGPKPIILDTNDFADLGMLLQGSKRDTSAIEFGAHQVVLVQNDASKEGVPPELSCGLVLSIYEAKGLEFDDVLLFNFFKDSPAGDEWRVIASNIENMEEEVSATDFSLRVTLEEQLECSTRALDFDYNKHKLLNSELKKLYTAITRARVNVWIFDEDKKKRAPIFEMFLRKDLVTVMKLEENSAEQRAFAERSSEADWRRQGYRFYQKCLWKLAMKCFQSGKDTKMQEKCCAQLQGALAESLAREWKIKKTPKLLASVHEEFKKAAKMFLENQLFDEAKVCLRNLKAWKHLGKIYEKQNQFSTAATYYQMTSENMSDAVRCCKAAGNYKKGIKILKDAGSYFKCIELCIEYDAISKNRTDKNYAALSKQFSAEAASKTFYENSQFEDMQSALNYLSYEEQYNFLKMREDCEVYLLKLYENHGKTQLIIDHYIEKRLFFEAANAANDVDMKAKYLLMATRQLHSVPKSREQEELIKKEINRMLTEENVSKNVKNDLLFYIMQMTRDISNIQSILSYYHSENNTVMVLLTVFCCLKFSSDLIYKIIPGIGSLFKFIFAFTEKVFEIILGLACEKELENEELVLKVFGMQKDPLNSKMVLYQDETKIRYLMACCNFSTYQQIPKNGTRVGFLDARKMIKDVFIKMLMEVVSLLKKQLDVEVKYAMTQVHIESCSHEGCAKSHNPSATSFGTGINSFVSLLKLNALCLHYHAKFIDVMKMKDFMNRLLEFSHHDDTVINLGRFIFSYMSYLHLLDIDQYCSCLTNISKPVENLLFSFLRRKWKIENDTSGFVDVNKYLMISLFSYLLSRESPVCEELLFAATEVKNHHLSYKTVNGFYDYLVKLYIKKKILPALSQISWCITTTIRHQKPDLITICELIEIPLVVNLLAVSKLTPTIVYLPERMVVYKDFKNSFYSLNREASIDMSVDKLANTSQRRDEIQKELEKMLAILSGAREHRLNLVDMLHRQISSFTKGSYNKILEQLACERILVIYYVFLANLPHWLKGGERIIEQFKARSIEGKGKLAKLFNRLRNVKNPEEVKNTLRSYLESSKQDLVEFDFQKEWVILNSEKADQKWTIKSRAQLAAIGSSVDSEKEKKEKSDVKMDSEKYRDCWNEVVGQNDNEKDSNDVSGNGFVYLDDVKFGDDLQSEEKEEEESIDIDDDLVKKKKETIQQNIKATKIQEWWRCVKKRQKIIKDMMENFKRYKAVSLIQRWWRHKRLRGQAMVEVKKRTSISTDLNHDKYFDSNGKCKACLVNVGAEFKDEHLQEGSNHYFYAEMYDKFTDIFSRLMDLNDMFEDRKDLICEKSLYELEESLAMVSLRYNSARQTKNWQVAPELEATILTLSTKVKEAIGSANNIPLEDNVDDFELVVHKKKKKSTQNKPKTQKKKKR